MYIFLGMITNDVAKFLKYVRYGFKANITRYLEYFNIIFHYELFVKRLELYKQLLCYVYRTHNDDQ